MVNANQTEIAEREKKPGTRKANLPRRSKHVVKLQAKERSPLVWILEIHQIQEGFFMAGVINVIDDYVITTILNTNDVEVEILEPSVEVDNEPVDSAFGIEAGCGLDDRIFQVGAANCYVVKFSSGAINNTLTDEEYNPTVTSEGSSNITGYMDALKTRNTRNDTFSASQNHMSCFES
jgi:hypothetical protein